MGDRARRRWGGWTRVAAATLAGLAVVGVAWTGTQAVRGTPWLDPAMRVTWTPDTSAPASGAPVAATLAAPQGWEVWDRPAPRWGRVVEASSGAPLEVTGRYAPARYAGRGPQHWMTVPRQTWYRVRATDMAGEARERWTFAPDAWLRGARREAVPEADPGWGEAWTEIPWSSGWAVRSAQRGRAVPIRAWPQEAAQPLGRAEPGDGEALVTGWSQDAGGATWYRIEHHQRIGWVPGREVEVRRAVRGERRVRTCTRLVFGGGGYWGVCPVDGRGWMTDPFEAEFDALDPRYGREPRPGTTGSRARRDAHRRLVDPETCAILPVEGEVLMGTRGEQRTQREECLAAREEARPTGSDAAGEASGPDATPSDGRE